MEPSPHHRAPVDDEPAAEVDVPRALEDREGFCGVRYGLPGDRVEELLTLLEGELVDHEAGTSFGPVSSAGASSMIASKKRDW